MLKTSLLALVLVTSATTAGAQTAPTPTKMSESFLLSATGDGAWSIWCDYSARDGDMKHEITPGKDHAGSLAVAKFRGGFCHYAGGQGPLTMTITADSWACPFKVALDAKCEQAVPAFASGQFRLSRRAAVSR